MQGVPRKNADESFLVQAANYIGTYFGRRYAISRSAIIDSILPSVLFTDTQLVDPEKTEGNILGKQKI